MFLRTLVATDSPETIRRIEVALAGIEAIVRPIDALEELRRRLAVEPFDLVVLDTAWRPARDARLIPELVELLEAPEVIVLTRAEDARRRAEMLAAGAEAAIRRDLPSDLFIEEFARLAERRLEETRARLRPLPDDDYRLGDYVTRSPAMREVLRLARRIAERDTTVLLLGETGVGKGLLARSLHNESARADGPFVAMNCGALTESLLEAELFGHERGAYTGADRARRGYFELAHRGTLFLDEIAEMPLHLQVKLLQVVEDRRVRPVGSEKKVDVDVRLIAATNRDLSRAVREARFREDLFYRLNVVTLTLPPLRERREDIPEIAASYVEHLGAQMGGEARRLSKDAMRALIAYAWPGNVRELGNAIERAFIMARAEEIQVEDLAVDIQTMAPDSNADLEHAGRLDADPRWLRRPWSAVRKQVVEETELRYLRALLADTKGRIAETARRAGMDPRSLREKMKKYGLRKEEFRV
jgi:DNA-binding NtrC family response regulator